MRERCDMTKAEHRASIAKHAAEAFKDHVLTNEGDGRWLCSKPGTGIYHFRIIFSPGCVFMYGDIYDLCLMCYDHDSLQWLRTAPHLDYVMGKSTKPSRVFLPAEAEAYLQRTEADEEDNRRGIVGKIREAWEDNQMEDDRVEPAMAWRFAYVDATGDTEPPACDDWDEQMLYQWHGLQKFVALYEQQQQKEAA